MLTAEVAFNDHEWYNVVKLLDEKFGFDCYLNGHHCHSHIHIIHIQIYSYMYACICLILP